MPRPKRGLAIAIGAVVFVGATVGAFFIDGWLEEHRTLRITNGCVGPASVTIDGAPHIVGTGIIEVEIAEGRHAVDVRLANGHHYTREIVVEDGRGRGDRRPRPPAGPHRLPKDLRVRIGARVLKTSGRARRVDGDDDRRAPLSAQMTRARIGSTPASRSAPYASTGSAGSATPFAAASASTSVAVSAG